MSEQKTLWGWCYKDHDGKLTWMRNHEGRPVFSEHRHEILAYNIAVFQDEPDRLSSRLACMVGPDGHPVELATASHVAAAVDQCDPGSNRQLTLDFLELPHYVRLQICHDLDLPWGRDVPNSAAQFVPSFRDAVRRGELDALRCAVTKAKAALASDSEDATMDDAERIRHLCGDYPREDATT